MHVRRETSNYLEAGGEQSAVEKAGDNGLAEGARISFELKTGPSGKVSAEALQMDDSARAA
ncbi:hypothetical protein ACVWW6_000323 [Bradyrhizobium sp. USDA 3311]